MKKISKRIAAFMLALVMIMTILGADTLSVVALEANTESIVHETYNGEEVTKEVTTEPSEVISDEYVSTEVEDEELSTEDNTVTLFGEENAAADVEDSDDEAIAFIQEDAGLTLKIKGAWNNKSISSMKLDLSDDETDISKSIEAVWDTYGDTDGVSDKEFKLSYDKNILKVTKNTINLDSDPDYTVKALSEGKSKVTITLNAKVKVFNGTYRKVFGIKFKNYDEVSKSVSASFDVTVYDSHTYSYVLSKDSSTNVSLGYCVAEKGKKGFIVKKNYSSVGEIVSLTDSSVAKISNKTYTSLFFVKGDKTTKDYALSVNGENLTLMKISDVQKTLGENGRKWWDVCNWFGKNGYDLSGALETAAAAGYTYVAYVESIKDLSNEKDNIVKVTSNPKGQVYYNMNGGTASEDFEETDEDGIYTLVDDVKYYYGQKITLPGKNPTLDGYTFSGWSDTEDGIGSFDITYPNEGSIVLYATWTINTYTVTFWNGQEAFDTQIVEYNNKASEPEGVPTMEADDFAVYSFAKWVDKDGEEFDFDSQITSDTDVYAEFSTQYMTYIFKKLANGRYYPNGWKLATKIPANSTDIVKKIVTEKNGRAYYKDIDDIVNEADVRKALSLPDNAVIKYVKFSKWPEGLHMDVEVANDLTEEDVEISVEDIYYGETQLLSTIVYDGKTLVEGTDYEIYCEERDYNTIPGVHEATIKFMGEYTGEKKAGFNVNAVIADFYKKYYDPQTNSWAYTEKGEIGTGILTKAIYEMTCAESWNPTKTVRISAKNNVIKESILVSPVEGKCQYILLQYDGKKQAWRVEFYEEYANLNFYVTKLGHTVPNNLKSDKTSYYNLVGKGVLNLDLAKPTLDKEEIASYVVTYPTDDEMATAIAGLGYTEAEINDFGLTIVWIRLIEESDGWHVDGDVYQTKDKGEDINPIPYERKTVTVSWLDEDGETALADSETYFYGETPSYKGEIPTKESDFDYIYSFAGFEYTVDDEVDVLSENTVLRGDTDFVAKYEKIEKEKSVINFIDSDSNIIKTVIVTYENGERSEIEVPASPVKKATNSYSYEFLGWYELSEDGTKTIVPDVESMDVPAGSVINLIASYDENEILYTVNFYNEDGTLLLGTVDTYTYNELLENKAIVSPVVASTAVMDYVFNGWRLKDGTEVTNVTDNIDVYASYESAYIDYVVTFKNFDGTVLSVNKYHYGDLLNTQAIPLATRLSDDSYEYLFAGWNNEDGQSVAVNSTAVKSSFVLIATYTATAKASQVPNVVVTPKADDKSTETKDDTKEDDTSNVNTDKKSPKKKTSEDDATATADETNSGDSGNQTADIPEENAVPLDDGVTDEMTTEVSTEATTEEITEASTENPDTFADDDLTSKDIPDDMTPLGAREDLCIIHWIILLLTLAVAIYTIIRVVAMSRIKENQEEKQEA